MTTINLLLILASGETDLRGIDHDDVIAGIKNGV